MTDFSQVDGMLLGKRSQTKVAVTYLENLADSVFVAEVHHRLAKIDIDDLLESGYLEQLTIMVL